MTRRRIPGPATRLARRAGADGHGGRTVVLVSCQAGSSLESSDTAAARPCLGPARNLHFPSSQIDLPSEPEPGRAPERPDPACPAVAHVRERNLHNSGRPVSNSIHYCQCARFMSIVYVAVTSCHPKTCCLNASKHTRCTDTSNQTGQQREPPSPLVRGSRVEHCNPNF